MGAAAELAGERSADVDDTDDVRILLAEERHRARALRVLEGHVLGADLVVRAHGEVGDVLDLGAHLRARRLRVGVVEAHVSGLVERTGLDGVGAEDLPQGRVDEVGGRMRLGTLEAMLVVDLGEDVGADGDLAVDDLDAVGGEALDRVLHVEDAGGEAVTLDEADIGALATGFGVERGEVEDEVAGLSGGEHLAGLAVDDDAADPGIGLEVVIADELASALLEQGGVGGEVGVSAALLRLRIGLRSGALFGHERAESGLIDVDSVFGGHLEGEVDGEAVGVVEGEGDVAGDRLVRVLELLVRGLEELGAGFEGPQERLLLGVGDARDPVEIGLELGVRVLHRVHRHGQQRGHDLGGDAEEAHRAHGTADEAAEDVAASLIAGAHAVADDHQGRADVVGDDAHLHVGVVVGAVLTAREATRLGDDGEDLVDLVHVLDVLEEEGDAFEAHAGVDVLRGQLAGDVEVDLGADLGEFELHEDEVPDLDVAILIGDRSALGAVGGTAVVVDLGAVAAGSGLTGVPEVVLVAAQLDPLTRDRGLLEPEVDGLEVVLVDGGPEQVGVEAEAAFLRRGGEQTPRVADGFALEVVAEGEVAVHLEERAVTGGLAHLFDVGGAHALLDARGAEERRRLATGEVRDELDHARDVEEDRGIGADDRRRGHDHVSVRLEVVEPALFDLCRLHPWPFRWCVCGGRCAPVPE
ncbi:Uncharacterised protein [Mycobacteroides abscessus subsp. abscessus]|nr:Uncharacterised protein [Mycobacteroides abscessus subsp. abscessus]